MSLKAKRFLVVFMAALMLILSVPVLPIANSAVFAADDDGTYAVTDVKMINEAGIDYKEPDGGTADLKVAAGVGKTTLGFESSDEICTVDIEEWQDPKLDIQVGYAYVGETKPEKSPENVSGTVPVYFDEEWDFLVTVPVEANEEFTLWIWVAYYDEWAWHPVKVTVSVADADYSAVDTAISKIPADLSVYTDDSAKAVNTAKNAVKRNFPATKQSQVNKMAQDIEDAIKGLIEKTETPKIEKIPYDGEKVKYVKADLKTTFGMLGPLDEGSTWEIDGNNVVLHIITSNSNIYAGIQWGSIEDVKAGQTAYDIPLEYQSDGSGNKYYELILSKDYCGFAHPVAPIKTEARGGGTTGSQYYLAIPPEDKIPVKQQEGADYTSLDAAIASAEAIDKTKYTDESVSVLNTALTEAKAVARDLKADSQSTIDTALTNLNNAISALQDKPAASKAEKFKYEGNAVIFIKKDGSGFGMWAPQEGTTIEKDGNDIVIHYVPKNKTTYVGFHWGDITDDLTTDVKAETEGTFNITVDKTYCGYAHPIAPIKASDGGTSKDQYYLAIPSEDKIPEKEIETDIADYTALDKAIADAEKVEKSKYTDETVSALETALTEAKTIARDLKEKDQAMVDAAATKLNNAINALAEKTEDPKPEDPKPDKKVDLYPINDELMFKVVNAYLETKDGKTDLVFALNGPGYEDVIFATYEEALSMGGDKSSWIHFTEAEVYAKYTDKKGEQDDGLKKKYQFRAPVTVSDTGVTKIAIVSISDREAKAAEKANPEAPDYSNAFKARQFVIDMDAKTIRTGNYEENETYKVDSKPESFKVADSANVYVFGNEAANEYIVQPTLVMLDETYDKAFVGTKEDASTASEKVIAIGSDKNVVIKFYNSRNDGSAMINGTEPITVAFHVAETGEWVERYFSIDVDAKTITITGEEIKTKEEIQETPANYRKVEEAKAEAAAINKEIFTEDSLKLLDDAINAVKENLSQDKQEEVNDMADKINNAMKGLVLKDGIYTIPSNSLGNDILDMIIEVENGTMSAYIIMTGRSQDKVYKGNVTEAENGSDPIDRIGSVKNSQGMPRASMFKIPIAGLNDKLEYAIHAPDGWTDRIVEISAKDIQKGEYEIIENANGEFVPGEEFTVSSSADFSKFVAVIVDDELIDASNYAAVSGSTRVTFSGDYTNALGETSHEVKILSHDGLARTIIKGVKRQNEETEPVVEPGNENGGQQDTEQGTEPGKENGGQQGTEQGAEPGKENGGQQGTEQGTASDGQQGTEAGNESGSGQGTGTTGTGESKTSEKPQQPQNNSNTRVARTGDNSHIGVYVILLIATSLGIALVYRKKHR